jgi:hypothetical protein
MPTWNPRVPDGPSHVGLPSLRQADSTYGVSRMYSYSSPRSKSFSVIGAKALGQLRSLPWVRWYSHKHVETRSCRVQQACGVAPVSSEHEIPEEKSS